MAQHQHEMHKTASFGQSVMSGIAGTFKGALAGGIVGAIGGALVGTLVAGVALALAPVSGGLSASLLLVGGSAAGWAAGGAAVMGTLGSAAGMVTGVVKSREAGQPSAQDIVNVAKVSFAQGVQVGAHVEQMQGKMRISHREQEEIRRTKTVMAEHHSLQ